ncbi:MAG: NfeD family protein, partial [Dehalococcoidia bacterium]
GGELLTLTAAEAQQWGYADGVATDRAELLAMSDLAGSSVVETSPELAENAVRFLTNPVVAALLIAAGVLLLLVELFTAGFGLAGVLGLALLALFFWGHFIAGLAGWEGVALVAVGLTLIALEVFVIPGFGVAGILGLVALVGGLFISLIDDEIVTRGAVVRAGSTVGLAVFTVVAGAMALLWLLPRLPWLRGLVLQTNVALPEPVGGGRSLFLADVLDRVQPDDRAYPPTSETRLPAGATGVALSDLRPGGYAQIGGARVDVVSRGEYIPAGEAIAVIADEGYRRVVRRADESDTGAPDADVSGVR